MIGDMAVNEFFDDERQIITEALFPKSIIPGPPLMIIPKEFLVTQPLQCGRLSPHSGETVDRRPIDCA